MSPSTFNATARRYSRVVLGCTVLAVILGGIARPSVVCAGDKVLPKGEAVLDKYVETTGGKAAYAKLNNRVTKGTFEIPAMGIKAAITGYAARPNQSYVVVEGTTVGKIEEGTDGKVAWEIHPMMGSRIKEGEERASALREAAFDGMAQWRKLYKTAECVGVENVDDQPCYRVVMTPHQGEAEKHYYGQESGLLLRMDVSIDTPMGTLPVEIYPSDYKKISGILLAYSTRVRLMGQDRVIKTESVKYDVEMPPDRFKLPEGIQALVDPKAAENEKTEKTPVGGK